MKPIYLAVSRRLPVEGVRSSFAQKSLGRLPTIKTPFTTNVTLLPSKRHVKPAQANGTGEAETQKKPTDRRAGRSTYRPSSYNELVDDAVQSIVSGLNDGLMRMEVEFPAVSNVDGELAWNAPCSTYLHQLYNDNGFIF
jgi:hypothetical protein